MPTRCKRTRLTAVAGMLLLLGAAAGCRDDGSPSGVPTAAFSGGLHCLTSDAAADTSAGTPDCVAWSYDLATGRLTLNHTNAMLNCCPETEPRAVWEDGVLVLVEDETGGLCDCLCVYDLAYTCTGVPPVTIPVVVRGKGDPIGEPALTGTLDLGAETRGEFCVVRTTYPWYP